MSTPTIFTAKPTSNFLDAVILLPETYEEFAPAFNFTYRRIAQGVNGREIAKYDCIDQVSMPTPPGNERVTGQTWFGATPQAQRLAYRKIVVFPALTSGANVEPHFLGDITGYTFTLIRCVLQDPTTPSFAPLSNEGTTDTIDVGNPNVTINLPGGSPWIGYTAIVILEYLKV